MDIFAVLVSGVYQFATSAAFLLLIALGLIVILGMMNIINLAHGELMMLGAYTASTAVMWGLPFPLAVVAAFFAVALFGALLERSIIHRFYGRELGALVVTWEVSLILAQGSLLLFGPFRPSIQIPGGSVSVGRYSYSVYWLVLMAISILAVATLWWVYNRTRFGLQARAVMQDADMARALGVDSRRIYLLTFSIGAGLAGFSGALLAPTTSIMPFMGQRRQRQCGQEDAARNPRRALCPRRDGQTGVRGETPRPGPMTGAAGPTGRLSVTAPCAPSTRCSQTGVRASRASSTPTTVPPPSSGVEAFLSPTW